MNKEMVVVLDRVTSENNSLFADFVTCMNCGKTMLVNLGEDRCPECDEVGTLSFEQGEPEIEYDNAACILNQLGYILCDIEE